MVPLCGTAYRPQFDLATDRNTELQASRLWKVGRCRCAEHGAIFSSVTLYSIVSHTCVLHFRLVYKDLQLVVLQCLTQFLRTLCPHLSAGCVADVAGPESAGPESCGRFVEASVEPSNSAGLRLCPHLSAGCVAEVAADVLGDVAADVLADV